MLNIYTNPLSDFCTVWCFVAIDASFLSGLAAVTHIQFADLWHFGPSVD
jgi:hypothetical protein